MHTLFNRRGVVAALSLALASLIGLAGLSPRTALSQEASQTNPAAPAVQATPRKNHLANEKSLYLLQHAENPVDWRPWGDEAFALAKKLDKPIFLSIGYSTCHWCHVMEEESFEDAEVAKLLNETFVCIKVDREERPDVDNLYMTLCQMATGSGGWPLNIVLTPEKRPFYVTTYVPKNSKFGRAGMLQLIPAIATAWKDSREEVEKQAAGFIETVKQQAVNPPGDGANVESLQAAFDDLASRYDAENAGFGSGTKFPTPHQLVFLLRYSDRTGDEKACEMALATLRAMRRGGIFDHVGLGFHRYSTDPKWLAPHFEKMLYDQATLLLAYAEAYHLTRDEQYRRVCEEIATYVLRDMRTPEGMFASAEDADSDGEEGRFYVWTLAEFRTALGDDADFGVSVFNVEPDGNFVEQISEKKTGENILHLTKSREDLAKEFNLSLADFDAKLETVRAKLFAVREKRVHPLKDDKVLTDWNGLMIAALARASWICERPEWLKAASDAADAVLAKLHSEEGKLLHRYRDGQAALACHIDDYAMFTWGLLELYEASFEVKRIGQAQNLTNELLQKFWDEKLGGFWYTASDAEELLLRQKEVYDGATPSGNSIALLNLLRLSRITGDRAGDDKAAALVKAFSVDVKGRPSAHAQFLQGVMFGLGPTFEIVVTGDSRRDDCQRMLAALRGYYQPSRVVLLRREEQETPDILRFAPFTETQRSIKGQATAYVCREHSCQAPTASIETMLKSLTLPKPARKPVETPASPAVPATK